MQKLVLVAYSDYKTGRSQYIQLYIVFMLNFHLNYSFREFSSSLSLFPNPICMCVIYKGDIVTPMIVIMQIFNTFSLYITWI